MQREADELTVELVELKQQLHTAARFKWIEAEDDSDHQAKPSAFSCAESWQNSICWEKMISKKIVGFSKLCMEFNGHLLLSPFLCFLHLQVQSQPSENTPTLKGPDAPAVKNRWTRRSETTTPTDATAQRSSRWPRSEIV